jgi:hypothetical protein
MYRTLIFAEQYRDRVFAGTEQPLVFGEPQPWIARKVTVVYVAGYLLPGQDGANLPADITRATIITAAAMFEAIGRDPLLRSESTDGVTAASYLDPRANAGGVPPQAENLLSNYREIRI